MEFGPHKSQISSIEMMAGTIWEKTFLLYMFTQLVFLKSLESDLQFFTLMTVHQKNNNQKFWQQTLDMKDTIKEPNCYFVL